MVKTYEQSGKFVVLEGIEGCGKTTLLNALSRHYTHAGKKVFTTREPGGSPLGESIRNTVLTSKTFHIHPLSELFLIEAARNQHCQEVLLPAKQVHDLILCDRFTLSSLAYQGKARGLGMDLVLQLNQIATQHCTPDLILFLDLSIDEALLRRNQRNQNQPHCVDNMERESLEFHRQVALGYKEALPLEPNVQVLKANATTEKILADACKLIDQIL